MQRAKTRGADLLPDPGQYKGINAEKCVRYLRGIGVEIDDATADSWLDIQGMHRFLASEKNTARSRHINACRCGATRWYSEWIRSRRKYDAVTCAKCKQGWGYQSLIFTVARDGSVQDYRPKDHRWQPLDMTPLEGPVFLSRYEGPERDGFLELDDDGAK